MTDETHDARLFSRRQLIGLVAGGAATFTAAFLYLRFGRQASPEAMVVTLHTTADCPCCHKWAAHLEANGFQVQTMLVNDLAPVKRKLGVPAELESCHSAEVGGYVVEGHVPADLIRRFLAERSSERGLAVPGMPGGSPGMESDPKVPYEVIAFSADGRTRVFARA